MIVTILRGGEGRSGGEDFGDVLAGERGLVVGAGVHDDSGGTQALGHLEQLPTVDGGDLGQRPGRRGQAGDELLDPVVRGEADGDGAVDVGQEDLSRLARKWIFATDWPGVPGTAANARAVVSLGLPDDVVPLVLGGNALRVYAGLDPA